MMEITPILVISGLGTTASWIIKIGKPYLYLLIPLVLVCIAYVFAKFVNEVAKIKGGVIESND